MKKIFLLYLSLSSMAFASLRFLTPLAGPVAPPFSNTKSLLFNGGTDHVEIPYSAAIDYDAHTTPGSIAFWRKATAAENAYTVSNYGNSAGFAIQTNFGGNSNALWYIAQSGGGFIFAIGTTFVSLNVWVAHVYTWDGTGALSGLKHYINGVDDPIVDWGVGGVTQLTSSTSSSTTWYVSGFRAGGQNITGSVDELSFYNRALTLSEAVEFYHGGAGVIDVLTASFSSALLPPVLRMGDPPDNSTTLFDRLGSLNSTITGAVIQSDVP